MDTGKTLQLAIKLQMRQWQTVFAKQAQLTVQGDDPEPVHQLRVLLRHLDAMLQIFKSWIDKDQRQALAKELDWLMAELGQSRDWAVFCDSLLPKLLLAHPKVDAQYCLTQAQMKAASHQVQLRLALNSPRFVRLQQAIAQLGKQLGVSITDEASEIKRMMQLLERGDKKLRSKLHQLDSLTMRQLHQRRIDIKQQRYLAVVVQGLLPQNHLNEHYSATLAMLQSLLGHLQDMAVAKKLFQQLLDARSARRDASTLVRETFKKSRQKLFKHLAKAEAQFKTTGLVVEALA